MNLNIQEILIGNNNLTSGIQCKYKLNKPNNDYLIKFFTNPIRYRISDAYVPKISYITTLKLPNAKLSTSIMLYLFNIFT